MKKIVLASSSPRRRKILGSLGFDFSVASPDFDENSVNDVDPILLCKKIAKGKGLSVLESINFDYKQKAQNYSSDSLIISADTIVFCKDNIFGKPKTRGDAKGMLKILSNSEHKVVTALCCIDFCSKKIIEKQSVSSVFFKNMTPAEIEFYLNTDEWIGVAGAYKIQGKGAFFIKKIEGSHSNIVGLPIFELYEMLKEFNFMFE